jgi:MFS family permease
LLSDGYRTFLIVTLPLAAMNLLNQSSRTVMTIIGPVLAVEFSLSASELGLMAACMFAVYALVQLPGGLALDLFGPRRVQAVMCLITSCGFVLFAVSDSLAGFVVARMMLGFGISLALIAILKANSQWFAPARVAGMTGTAMVVGSLGSVLTTAPVEAILPALGWRGVFWVLAIACLIVAAWIHLSVRDKPAAAMGRTLGAEIRIVGAICISRAFWRYGPGVALLSVLNFTYLGLWAGPWLRDVAGFDSATRARTLLFYTLAMMTGAFVIGQTASRAQARGHPAILVPALCIAGLLVAQIGLILRPTDFPTVTILWVMFAFFGAGGPAGYVAIGQMFPPDQTGRVSTAINTLTLGAAFLLQALIGWILDLWPRTASGGWEPRGYSIGLMVTVALHLFAAAQLSGWRWPRRRPG